ncbi:MAG: alpha-N-arabinofuranosidase [Armatimonadetes bacterium]|nr:alpha-N-arabinofuranosidase [Armatimonadota bacterium]
MTTTLTLDNDYELSPVDPRLFGGFAEHLGRHIYTGMVEPGHETADADGFRTDVLELVRELNVPIVRYPGGNFVSGYNWEDGVGAVESRPRRLDLAWHSTEPNTFGTNEFMRWCEKANTEPMLAVNLGTRGADAARNLVEYCNHPGGTYWSDLRRSHGVAAPHKVKTWCLGNEMDGGWQMGQKSATEYGALARETAKLMKWTDSTIETIVCGSSSREMATFGKWEWDVLQECYENVDYLSLHVYYGNRDGNTPRFLAKPDSMAQFIDEAISLCDAVGASKKQTRKINLSFDEWNVWFHSNAQDKKMQPWQVAPPLLEDIYTMEDALVLGGMLITLLNRADRVKIGCLAQLVNVIAPIMTAPGGGAWRQTIFYPFAQASNNGRGTVLRVGGTIPETKEVGKKFALAAVRSEQGDKLTLFVVNREMTETLPLNLTLRGFGDGASVTKHTVLQHDNLKARNTEAEPFAVVPREITGASVTGETLSARLPPASWNVLEIALR